MEVPTEEEEEETYFKPSIEEPKGLEEVENPILEPGPEPYIFSEGSTMVGEGEGEVHNLNGEKTRIEVVRGGGRGGEEVE